MKLVWFWKAAEQGIARLLKTLKWYGGRSMEAVRKKY
jgi:hypothetical protein